MTGMHSSMNLSHNISRWVSECQVPHFERHTLTRQVSRSPVAARACACPATHDDNTASLIVIGMNGCDSTVIVPCCRDHEHLAAWLVLHGLWPIITGSGIQYAIAMTDFRWITQVPPSLLLASVLLHGYDCHKGLLFRSDR